MKIIGIGRGFISGGGGGVGGGPVLKHLCYKSNERFFHEYT